MLEHDFPAAEVATLLITFLVIPTAPVISQEALGVNYNQFLTSIQEQEINQV